MSDLFKQGEAVRALQRTRFTYNLRGHAALRREQERLRAIRLVKTKK